MKILILLIAAALSAHAADVSLTPPVFLPDWQEFKTWAPRVEFSRTYHVDQRQPKASDRNPGTAERPFRTIGRAAELRQPSDVHFGALGQIRAEFGKRDPKHLVYVNLFLNLPVKPVGQWHEYMIPVGTHPNWQGRVIRAIRLDPTTGGAALGSKIELDWIKGE